MVSYRDPQPRLTAPPENFNLVGATLTFVLIGTGLLRFYLETTKKEP